MNEEIEYAEMLEIPVSTVNVVRKKNRRAKNANLKEKLISRVNRKVAEDDFAAYPEEQAENVASESASGERIDTVLLGSASAKRKRGIFAAREDRADESERDFGNAYADLSDGDGGVGGIGGNDDAYDAYQNGEPPVYEAKGKADRRAGIALTVEFALACTLCGAIFLTNVFMPSSAINTFFRGLTAGEKAKADTRAYSDCVLTGVVSDLSDAEITVSPAGVLSFTDACCVYPVVDGTVAAVTRSADGRYEVKISHTDSFYGVIGGLDYVYYAEGDDVYSNVPVGYSNGEAEVRVILYSEGEILTCYTVGEDNGLSWVSAES